MIYSTIYSRGVKVRVAVTCSPGVRTGPGVMLNANVLSSGPVNTNRMLTIQ